MRRASTVYSAPRRGPSAPKDIPIDGVGQVAQVPILEHYVIDCLNRHNVQAVEGLLSDRFRDHDPLRRPPFLGPGRAPWGTRQHARVFTKFLRLSRVS